MSTNIDEIIEKLKNISLLEASELIKKIEQTFDVNTTMASISPVGGSVPLSSKVEEDTVEEKTEFDVVLQSIAADKMISAIKCTRKLTGLGLKESKELVVAAPSVILNSVAKEKAEEAKKIFAEEGIEIVIK